MSKAHGRGDRRANPPKDRREEATARFVHAMMSWAEKSGRAFRLEELPGLIGKTVGVDEKEVKAIVDRWQDD